MGIAVASAGHWQEAEDAVHRWTRAMRTRRVLLVSADERCAGLFRGPAASAGSAQDARPLRSLPSGRASRQCPHRLASQMLTADFLARGETVVVLGRSGVPQVPGAAGERGTAVTVIATVEHARHFQPTDPDRLSFVLSPCTPVEPAAEILGVLRTRFPRLRGQHPDQWCYAESDFRAASASVTDASDLLITVGHGPFPAAGAIVPPKRHRHIDGLGDLHPDDLAQAPTLGLVERGPDSAHLTRQILTALSGLGPLSVVQRQYRTRKYDIQHVLRSARTSPTETTGLRSADGRMDEIGAHL
ncbi:hypothetical protein ACFZAM_12705 [Streptomyces sp. NPDC008079]|uniref:hypothetical protein n=1 Tax=Streptomyces sp. NPDC008079 TaxID=3364806 RepID=UPI0036EAFA32